MAIEAPVLDAKGKSADGVALDDAVFGAELKPHLIHETVRAEFGAARAGTRAAKSRGQVAGGGAKPWRQKGTGRARQGTIRAVQFAGGGVAFPPTMRSYGGKVNRKARASAMRSALSAHAMRGSIGVVNPAGFEAPSTKAAAAVLDGWGVEGSVLVVCDQEDVELAKSFRNIDRVAVTVPAELEVRHVVGARSLLFSTAALEGVVGKAS
jgi:large subunit ribosomal protein L4